MTAEQLEELLGKPVAWLYERKGFMPAVSQRKPAYTDLLTLTPLYNLARRVIAAERLVEALKFYADQKNWMDTPSWDGDPDCITEKAIPMQENGFDTPPSCDCGDTARAALTAYREVSK